VTGTDFYPTLLDLVGADLRPEEHQDGVSLAPLLAGNTIAERSLFWHYPHYGNQGGRPSSMIREGEWKLVRYHADSSEVLFNLEEDLQEHNDLSDRHPQVAGRLSQKLSVYLSETGAKFPRTDSQFDPQKEAQFLKEIENDLLPRLERQRMEYLSTDFNPGNHWWGSEIEE
jgi:arylsulfatase A-like enzyme